MRLVKTFVATLAAVLVLGGAFLVGKSYIVKSDEETNSVESAETAKSEKESIADSIKKKAIESVAETIVETAIKQYGGDSAEDLQKVMDSVTEEDKEKVTEILADNMSLDSIGDVQSYVSNKDVDGLMEYAQEKLTEEDYSELTGIFEKYSEEAIKQLDKAAD